MKIIRVMSANRSNQNLCKWHNLLINRMRLD